MDYANSTKDFRKALDKSLQTVKTVSITSHKSPDPDAYSCALAFQIYVNKNYPKIKADVIFEWKDPQEEGMFPTFNKIVWTDDLPGAISKYEINIFLDGDRYERFTVSPEKLSFEGKTTFCLDHHPNEPDTFDHIIVNHDKSSCAEMVADALFETADFLDSEISETLLLGIMADTGSFKYLDSKHSETLLLTAEILKHSKLNLQIIHQKLSLVSQPVYEVFQELVANTKFLKIPNCKYGFMYTFVSNEAHQRYGDNEVKLAKSNYFFGSHRNVKGHEWGFIVSPVTTGEHKFGVSFRSTPTAIAVAPLARHFGGGGHPMAASGDVLKDPAKFTSEQAVEEVLEELMKFDFSETYLS